MLSQAETHQPIIRGRREVSRAGLYVPAGFRLPEGKFDCLLEDVSQTGAKISLPFAASQRSFAILTCGPLDAFCTVIWTAHNKCGLNFDELVPLEIVLELRSYAETYPARDHHAFERIAEEWLGRRWRLMPC
jgi:PilZ domain